MPAPPIAPQNTASSPAPRYVGHAQVVRDVEAGQGLSGGVAQQHIGEGRDNDGADGQTIETVGQIDTVGTAHDHQDQTSKGVDDQGHADGMVLEAQEGHGQAGSELGRETATIKEPGHRNRAHQELHQ